MRILVLSPNYEHRYNRTLEYLRRELATFTDCVFLGEGYPGWSGRTDIRPWLFDESFDIVLVFHLKYLRGMFSGLESFKDVRIPTAAVLTDYVEHTYAHRNQLFNDLQLDQVYLNQTFAVADCMWAARSGRLHRGIKAHYLPFSINTEVFQNVTPWADRSLDVVAAFSTIPVSVYGTRDAVLSELRKLSDLRLLATSTNCQEDRVLHDQYIRLLNSTRLLCGTSSRQGCVTLRHYEAPACGAVILTNPAHDLERLGFVDNETCVVYRDVADLGMRIRSALDSGRLESVAVAGNALIHERHTTKIRARELYTSLQEVCGAWI